MALDETYNDSIRAFMRGAGRPVTMSEIAEAVGMSRAAAYQWRDRHAWELQEAGTGRHGAGAYTLDEDSPKRGQLPDVDLNLGETLEVTAVRVRGGRVLVDLSDGARIVTVQVIAQRMPDESAH